MLVMDQLKISVLEAKKKIPEELLRRGVIGEEEERLIKKAAAKKLRISVNELENFEVIKKSVDARKKEDPFLVYQIHFVHKHEKNILETYKKGNLRIAADEIHPEQKRYLPNRIPSSGNGTCIIAGFGPAGMFAALTLARAGFKPFVVERGMEADKRQKCVEHFWKTGILNPETNVQFGEGGAGTFSDGKLNTMVKDKTGKNRQVLETFVEFGAPQEILYLHKPHIGTDKLKEIVVNIRKEIIRLGGSVSFETKLVDIQMETGKLQSVLLEQNGKTWKEPCSALILATGHSAREIFSILKEHRIKLEPKAFAMGVRIEHPQEMIGKNQYGMFYKSLPPADYKLTYQTKNGRGVYSFCMCPGGYVVNSSSEEQSLVVNGMSNYLRDGKNANSAIVVTVSPEDFSGNDVLAGVEFQKKYEKTAFLEASGKIPVQLLGDFLRGENSIGFGKFYPEIKGAYAFGNLRNLLPGFIGESIAEGVQAFGKKIHGFDRADAILSGIESRTSSPVRICRDENFTASVNGIYPCGEGAGYAGGITSAAMDGIRVAEKILDQLHLDHAHF